MAIAPTEIGLKSTPEFRVPPEGRADTFAQRSFASRLLRHPLARVGIAIIALLFLVAVFAGFLTPYDQTQILPGGIGALGEPHAPGGGFPIGADSLGRDVWTRTLFGTRISLLVGVFAMMSAVTIGTTIGLISGYCGGWVDAVLMRLTEIVIALPTVLLAIALAAVLPDKAENLPRFLNFLWSGLRVLLPKELEQVKLFNLLLAIALVTWTGIARAVRGEVLSLKQREFVEAARAAGCSQGRIIWRHLLPNVLPTIIVLATLATANNILLEAGLSFLGLGVDPSTPSWGGTIAEGQPYVLSAPWILLAPGIAIVLAVTGFNLLGQALQETIQKQ